VKARLPDLILREVADGTAVGGGRADCRKQDAQHQEQPQPKGLPIHPLYELLITHLSISLNKRQAIGRLLK
jgi:hypothetical protein